MFLKNGLRGKFSVKHFVYGPNYRRGRKKDMTKQNMTNPVFGYQLLLDLYDCKEGVCDDLQLCYNFLDEIVGHLGMEKQTPPNIFRSDEVRFPDKAGL